MAPKLPLCDGGNCPCKRRVTKARNRFFDHSCAQYASRKPAATPADSVTVEGNTSSVVKYTPTRVKTLADLIRVCEIDTNEWHIERWVCNKWDNAAMPKGFIEAVITELYQVKVSLVRKKDVIAVRSELAQLKADFKAGMPVRKSVLPRKRAKTGHMLEISIPDLHVGKLSWAKETGGRNYDTKIAQHDFCEALETLIARTSSFTFDEIVFVVGNDLFNADNPENTTTAGTPQDTDSRYHKTFLTVRRMITAAIERLRQIAPVKVPIVGGNHDTMSAWHLGDSLECYFHNCEDVTIDNVPRVRKYHQFGRNMIMFTHGDKGKRHDYPAIMAVEEPLMWASSDNREVHTGHNHKTQVDEIHGIRTRTSPALCAIDAWHSEQGYVGNKQAAEAFVWHEREGIVNMAFYTVMPDLKEAA